MSVIPSKNIQSQGSTQFPLCCNIYFQNYIHDMCTCHSLSMDLWSEWGCTDYWKPVIMFCYIALVLCICIYYSWLEYKVILFNHNKCLFRRQWNVFNKGIEVFFLGDKPSDTLLGVWYTEKLGLAILSKVGDQDEITSQMICCLIEWIEEVSIKTGHVHPKWIWEKGQKLILAKILRVEP